jgi:hypothetical protein
MVDHSPTAQIAFGVIGHRPNRLPVEARDAVRAELERVLDVLTNAIEEAARAGSASAGTAVSRFALVSALAEGADQMSADAALQRGFSLITPLPFAVQDYASDFAEGDVRETYLAYVARSDEVDELPGRRDDQGGAYEAVGFAVIERCDVLLVIWDGGASAGRGGTTEMILAAARRDVPTVHIDARAQAPTRLLQITSRAKLNALAEIDHLKASYFQESVNSLAADIVARKLGGQ